MLLWFYQRSFKQIIPQYIHIYHKIYANFKVQEFRKRRHNLCADIFNLDKKLYNMIGVFQRRIKHEEASNN